jgi:hypothetical protein
MWELDLN